MIPKDIASLLKKNLVLDVLKKPLSPSTYKDYFAALLYAEDFCAQKRSDFQLRNVTLELHEAAIYDPPVKKKRAQKDDKIFVAFNIYSVPEKPPFLLSRDFVFARRSGSKNKKFQGVAYRVKKSNMVLVEFEEEFYAQHDPNRKYDVSFSFNRVCLKRAHQAISAASRGLFKHYLFPKNAIRKKERSSISGSIRCVYNNPKLDMNSNSAVHQILSFKGYPPYLVEGPLCVNGDGGLKNLSKTGRVVQEAILQIYQRSSSNCRILVCFPLNSTGDILLRSLKEHKIPESVMFRANAAFREEDDVLIDILPMCARDGECFSLPSLGELKQFRIIFSTFATSFRLLNHGITAGHFSHIFLVDSSSATEPQTMIPLSSFAIKNTTVVLTGAPDNHPSCVRSDIAGNNGLRMSYFERLRATNIYSTSNPTFIAQL
ncbi:P-loop containing nucleoside triphosphate hydrolase [Melia azedarach]|uniref:P-loop containing nucleoside triphosphate hydrolase n=1 Tax=Melia azedarach TaxID=155640 RepID=A0ACC1XH36_MELAZ|nr:P-loop containing nucleoside triphosphate hydrolase [Melia azedarach]